MTSHSRAERAADARPPESPAIGKPTLCMINYNGERYLPDSLRSAVAQADRFVEVMLIDNGSQDRSLEIVERDFPMVRIVRLPANRGAGAARNAGLREARSRLVLLVDNDVSLAPGCVDHLTRALDHHPDALIAAPAVLYAQRRDLIQFDGADNHFIGTMILHHQDLPLAAADLRVRETNSVVTACFLIDRSRLPELEPFDEKFFYMLEDHDFGVRMRVFGYSIISVPEARCYHGEGTVGLSIRQIRKYSKIRVYYLIRNRWLFISKNYSIRSLVLLMPAFLLYEIAQLVVVIQKGWLGEWWRAVLWMIQNSPHVLEHRRKVQKERRTPDRILLTAGPIPFREEIAVGPVARTGRRLLDAVLGLYWKGIARLV